MMNIQKHLLPQIMLIGRRKNLKKHSFSWQHEDRTKVHQPKELEGKSQKKRLTVPEISSEEPLEHSEIVNSKNSYFFLL